MRKILNYLYRRLTWKCFYITGTFTAKGERFFFRTVFYTYGSILPIYSLESKCKKEFQADALIILHFARLPLSMAKYVESEYDEFLDIVDTRERKKLNF